MPIDWPAPNQLFIDEKPGVRYYLIMAALSQLPTELDQQAYHQEALKIRITFDEKITLAKKYHEEGSISQAVALFEQLVEDGYDQIYPYTYLKEYYTATGGQEKLQWTQQALQGLAKSFQEKGINRPDLIEIIDT